MFYTSWKLEYHPYKFGTSLESVHAHWTVSNPTRPSTSEWTLLVYLQDPRLIARQESGVGSTCDRIHLIREWQMYASLHASNSRAGANDSKSVGIKSFHASSDWMDRFIQNSSVQTSFKLPTKGNGLLPALGSNNTTSRNIGPVWAGKQLCCNFESATESTLRKGP